MYRDESGDPPAIVCQVGSTTLKYHAARIDDLHSLAEGLRRLGRPRRGRRGQRAARRDASRPGVATPATRWADGTACARAIAGASGCTCRPLLEALGLAELTHDARNNRIGAI
jgi:hypothetical protein